MSEVTNRTKRLVAEMTVLICVVSVWVVKSEAVCMNDVKAGVFKQVVKADKDNVNAYRFLAGYYMSSGSYDEAAKALRQIIKIDPNDAYAHSRLGDAYWSTGRYEDAIAQYKQCIGLRMSGPHVRYQIALTYLQMGDKDSAQQEYEILKGMDEELANQLLVSIDK